jgi:DNA helicase TIP49 (TBP-interacting protein)
VLYVNTRKQKEAHRPSISITHTPSQHRFVQCPEGELQKRKEVVHVVSLHEVRREFLLPGRQPASQAAEEARLVLMTKERGREEGDPML